jgi:hypothetical protein
LLSQILRSYVARCFRLLLRATVKLLSTQGSEKRYKPEAEFAAPSRISYFEALSCSQTVSYGLFCLSPKVYLVSRMSVT